MIGMPEMWNVAINSRASFISLSGGRWIGFTISTLLFILLVGLEFGIMKLTLDHIYPVSKAYKDYLNTGTKRIYSINEIQPLCLTCNIVKNDRIE